MSKITESANGESCTLRTPWCNERPDTTVWCHAPAGQVFGRGTSHKSHDLLGCYDGRAHINDTTAEERRTMFLRGFVASLPMLIDKGLVVIA